MLGERLIQTQRHCNRVCVRDRFSHLCFGCVVSRQSDRSLVFCCFSVVSDRFNFNVGCCQGFGLDEVAVFINGEFYMRLFAVRIDR